MCRFVVAKCHIVVCAPYMRTVFLPGLRTSPALLLLSISMTNVTAGSDAAFKKTWQQTFMPYIYNKVIQERRKLNSKRFDSYFYIILTTTETTTTTRSNCSHRFHQVTKLQHGQQTFDSCQKHSSAKTNVVPVVLSHLWQTFKQYIPHCCPRCLCCRENLVNSPT